MVEQLAVNQRVVSSSLTLPANKNYSCKCSLGATEAQQTLNLWVVGSNPTGCTMRHWCNGSIRAFQAFGESSNLLCRSMSRSSNG